MSLTRAGGTGSGGKPRRDSLPVELAGIEPRRSRSSRVPQAPWCRRLFESFVFELTGAPEKVDAFIALMRPLNLRDVARTGVAAIARGV